MNNLFLAVRQNTELDFDIQTGGREGMYPQLNLIIDPITTLLHQL